jgi:hypothetical protein
MRNGLPGKVRRYDLPVAEPNLPTTSVAHSRSDYTSCDTAETGRPGRGITRRLVCPATSCLEPMKPLNRAAQILRVSGRTGLFKLMAEPGGCRQPRRFLSPHIAAPFPLADLAPHCRPQRRLIGNCSPSRARHRARRRAGDRDPGRSRWVDRAIVVWTMRPLARELLAVRSASTELAAEALVMNSGNAGDANTGKCSALSTTRKSHFNSSPI